MTTFIRQEALEKASEIRLKADEEFAIEKSKLVRAETASIDSAYEKKFKQAGMSQQITRSTLANRTRLRVLGARQELLDDLFERAGERLESYTDEKEKYVEILKNLILEGLYALNERNVGVRAREADKDAVKKAIAKAEAEYKDSVGKEVAVSLSEEWLEGGGKGGVSIVGRGGKIDINNTFEERLRLLETEALPMVRTGLFGRNENRKFYD